MVAKVCNPLDPFSLIDCISWCDEAGSAFLVNCLTTMTHCTAWHFDHSGAQHGIGCGVLTDICCACQQAPHMSPWLSGGLHDNPKYRSCNQNSECFAVVWNPHNTASSEPSLPVKSGGPHWEGTGSHTCASYIHWQICPSSRPGATACAAGTGLQSHHVQNSCTLHRHVFPQHAIPTHPFLAARQRLLLDGIHPDGSIQ